MSELHGYGGRILRVDLTRGTHRIEPVEPRLAEDYVGGRGFVARVLYDEIPPGADPLGPENKLLMAAGPLSGTFLPCASKAHLGAKSPATGGYGDANVGGHLAMEMKHAGYDLLIIEGQADRLSYLVVDDDQVAIRDAEALRGKGSIATETELKRVLGDDFQIATIGPAGERLVKFACITHDFGRQAGRAGMATVMGAKRLKAIAIRGSRGFPVADPEGVLAAGRAMFETIFGLPGFKDWTPYGTAGVTDWVNKVGAFPTRNFQTGFFEAHAEIGGKALRDRIHILDKGCFGCPIPCGKYSRVIVDGEPVYVEGPEYETVAMIGGDCCLDSIEAVAHVNAVMDDLGLDTISGGNVIAFALECAEKGIITPADVDGRELKFGDLDSVLWLTRRIAAREGIGDLLAEGVREAAAQLGKGSDRFAIHVKGLEVSGYDPRYAAAMALAYMTCDVGAHHNRAWAITHDVAVGRDRVEGKAARVIELQHLRPLFDMLGVCRFPWVEVEFEPSRYAEIYRPVTGQDRSWEELLRCSERVWNLTRMFWMRHLPGFGRQADQAPPRWYQEPATSGPTAGKNLSRETLEALLDDYYRLRGWDANGRPTRDTLKALGLDFTLADLERGVG
ncbi:MAG: aldehyde ferredoxin oxidoreductase family protein [bacterium]|nr:aldehyde ferredoxin oxidoreductase family protein [bacterium]